MTPPREDVEDVDVIARRLMPTLLLEGRQLKLSAKDVEYLRGYDWPVNVRELIKVLKRPLYLDIPLGDAIDEERRLDPLLEQPDDAAALCPLWPLAAHQVRSIEEVKREYAARALELNGGNWAPTAGRSGLRSTP